MAEVLDFYIRGVGVAFALFSVAWLVLSLEEPERRWGFLVGAMIAAAIWPVTATRIAMALLLAKTPK